MPKKSKVNRIGEVNRNTYGSLMTIVEYNNVHDITIEFENGYRVKNRYRNFQKGEVKSPYDKSVYNIGYVGEGDYKVSVNRKHTIQYDYWNAMLQRCYCKKTLAKYPTYKSCSVCEEWHNFQNFAKWFDENYYEIDGERMHIDKDILCKGNKIYSPDTCVFVPQRINNLFTKSNAKRGEYPIGIFYNKNVKKFLARCCKCDKTKKSERINLGYYDTPETAFKVYKEYKENYIKEVAEEYKNEIPNKLYNSMYRYIISIDD